MEKFCFSPKFFVFLRSLYCHFEKNPIFLRKMSFREKSYFFRKRQYFLLIFPVCTQLTLWVILIYILLYNNCFLIGLSPRIPRNPGTAAAHIISNFRTPSNLKSWRSPTPKNYTDTPHAYQNIHTKFHWNPFRRFWDNVYNSILTLIALAAIPFDFLTFWKKSSQATELFYHISKFR